MHIIVNIVSNEYSVYIHTFRSIGSLVCPGKPQKQLHRGRTQKVQGILGFTMTSSDKCGRNQDHGLIVLNRLQSKKISGDWIQRVYVLHPFCICLLLFSMSASDLGPQPSGPFWYTTGMNAGSSAQKGHPYLRNSSNQPQEFHVGA